jgi:membrane protein YdbS with pleckstrin-like domain
MTVANAIHVLLLVAAAIGFFRFWAHTRFWFPRYVHVMAVVALAIGVWLLSIVPSDAPLNKGSYTMLKQALIVLGLPALVYFVFIFHGGQHAAYESRQRRQAVRCQFCGGAEAAPGTACPACGQIVHQ